MLNKAYLDISKLSTKKRAHIINHNCSALFYSSLEIGVSYHFTK